MILTDPADMARIAMAACPDLSGLSVKVHDGGWDSIALEFGDTWMCKFPRDEDGIAALRREAALLARVRPRLTIAVPDMTVVEGASLFTRHRLLVGEALLTGDYALLSAPSRTRLASDIAGFLAELHAIDGDWAAIRVEADDDDDAGIANALGLLAPELVHAAQRMLADYEALGDDPLGRGLCYLDAHGRNFAFDHASGRLNGIFDFGDAALASRHEEFVEPAYISRDCAVRVIGAYEAVTGCAIDRRRVETLIGYQRLAELAADADHPQHGALVRALADDWFRAPSLFEP